MRTSVLPLVLAAACVPSAGPRVGEDGAAGPASACVLGSGETFARPPAVVTIGLTEPVGPAHAPVPQSDAERAVFAHLYETLVRVGCDGRVLPGLAASWTSHDGGRRWTFRLRDDARFWDGAPVAAHDVVFGKSGVGFTIGASDARTVSVMLARPTDQVPAALADPALAVTKPAPDGGWPIGTGRHWTTSGMTSAQEIRAPVANGEGSAAGDRDTLVFRIAASGDARDLLDAGVDLLVTRDPALRDYARTQDRFVVLPLPWDRTYVFVTPEPGGSRFDGLEDAVRAPARRAESPFWWLDIRRCGMVRADSPPRPPAGTPRRIVYPRHDAPARELAGRVAALTRGVAVARSASEFAAALAAGADWGYVLALPRFAPDPCRAARDLLPAWDATITALVDVRADAIVRRATARWMVEQDGTVSRAPAPPR